MKRQPQILLEEKSSGIIATKLVTWFSSLRCSARLKTKEENTIEVLIIISTLLFMSKLS